MPRGQGSGDFDYTSAGYMLFNNANDALQEFSKAIDRMQGLDLYIGAANDATREAIRNAFSTTSASCPTPRTRGIWLIISESATMEIDTGRKRLATRAPHGVPPQRAAYDGSRRPTLRRTAPDTYTFNCRPCPAPNGEFIYAEADNLGVRTIPSPTTRLEGYSAISLGTLHERSAATARQARTRGGDTRRRQLLGPHERR